MVPMVRSSAPAGVKHLVVTGMYTAWLAVEETIVQTVRDLIGGSVYDKVYITGVNLREFILIYVNPTWILRAFILIYVNLCY